MSQHCSAWKVGPWHSNLTNRTGRGIDMVTGMGQILFMNVYMYVYERAIVALAVLSLKL